MVIPVWIFGTRFLEIEWSEPVTSRKTIDSIASEEKTSNFEMKISIWKKFDSFLIFEDCSSQIGDITKCEFFWFCIVKWVNI